jgi:hypothetical protein
MKHSPFKHKLQGHYTAGIAALYSMTLGDIYIDNREWFIAVLHVKQFNFGGARYLQFYINLRVNFCL